VFSVEQLECFPASKVIKLPVSAKPAWGAAGSVRVKFQVRACTEDAEDVHMFGACWFASDSMATVQHVVQLKIVCIVLHTEMLLCLSKATRPKLETILPQCASSLTCG